ncbi:hypothetical protein BRADI_4g28415v3 [Brachypodium distachyon]|uniref:Uncharacterized protein n=1 Tax=Brachypodium distachyon TaxID=15368 RepID=A0A0Q3LBN8_BRADI|nr:hypothetical protein BRADI_4g28415v3 [Brachypodium distachyon]
MRSSTGGGVAVHVFKLARSSNKRLGCRAAEKKCLSGQAAGRRCLSAQANTVRRTTAAWRFLPPGSHFKKHQGHRWVILQSYRCCTTMTTMASHQLGAFSDELLKKGV